MLSHMREEICQRRPRPAMLKQGFWLWPCPIRQARPIFPGLREELKIQMTLPSTVSIQSLVHPDANTVLEQLADRDMIHFAGHGMSDHVDPFKSGLLLQAVHRAVKKKDKLSVRQISDAHLKGASMAYLSACSTAENRCTDAVGQGDPSGQWISDGRISNVVASMFDEGRSRELISLEASHPLPMKCSKWLKITFAISIPFHRKPFSTGLPSSRDEPSAKNRDLSLTSRLAKTHSTQAPRCTYGAHGSGRRLDADRTFKIESCKPMATAQLSISLAKPSFTGPWNSRAISKHLSIL
jgi:CHAT domain